MGKLKLKIATTVTGHRSYGKIETKDRRGREGGMAIFSGFPRTSCCIPYMHFYCYLTGGTAYLLERDSECFNGEKTAQFLLSYTLPQKILT